MKNTLAPKKHTLAIFERSEKEPVSKQRLFRYKYLALPKAFGRAMN
ncbi:MAG: hypothetical protein U5L45_20365 [Saprospiraceae bacterium]|nr:hypothetical protein [Saprospiraceae bacterium]